MELGTLTAPLMCPSSNSCALGVWVRVVGRGVGGWRR